MINSLLKELEDDFIEPSDEYTNSEHSDSLSIEEQASK
jgi:hypothetical protein